MCPFLVFPPKPPIPSPLHLLTNPLTPASSLSLHFPTLEHPGFTGTRASLFPDVQQGHPLLHMQLESWVPTCVLDWRWLDPWEFWDYGSYCSSSEAANTYSSLGPFSRSSIGDHLLSPLVGCDHPLLYLLGTSWGSQETAVSGSCQQAFVGIHNSVWVW